MPKVSLMTVEKAPVCDPPAGSRGAIESRALFARERDPIHVHVHRLGADADLRIAEAPTDRIAYVWKGAAEAGGIRLDRGGSALVERGAGLLVTAADEGAELIIYDAAQPEADDRPGGHVRLLPSDRVPRIAQSNGFNIGSAIFADSHSPSSRIWMHETEIHDGGDGIKLHSHTEDEVIFVIGGQIKLGNRLYDPGTAIAIAANTLYQFDAGPDGLTFINFRNKAPTYVAADGGLVLDEAEFFINHVGKPQYIDVPSN